MTEFHTQLINNTVMQIETTSFDKEVIRHAITVTDFKIAGKGVQRNIDYVRIDSKMYLIGVAKIWSQQ